MHFFLKKIIMYNRCQVDLVKVNDPIVLLVSHHRLLVDPDSILRHWQEATGKEVIKLQWWAGLTGRLHKGWEGTDTSASQCGGWPSSAACCLQQLSTPKRDMDVGLITPHHWPLNFIVISLVYEIVKLAARRAAPKKDMDGLSGVLFSCHSAHSSVMALL